MITTIFSEYEELYRGVIKEFSDYTVLNGITQCTSAILQSSKSGNYIVVNEQNVPYNSFPKLNVIYLIHRKKNFWFNTINFFISFDCELEMKYTYIDDKLYNKFMKIFIKYEGLKTVKYCKHNKIKYKDFL